MLEFELINRYFAPLAAGFPGAFGLTDDAAALDIPEDRSLMVTKDLINEGVHFIGTENPGDIARKLLRTNLSDLAAMGAVPHAYFLGLCLPQSISENWVANFAKALLEDQQLYRIHLAGGDTTSTLGKISLSLTAIGHVAKGKMLRRTGAQPGDIIYMSGTLGDAAFGLDVLKNRLDTLMDERLKQKMVARYLRPEPRIELGQALIGAAHAAIDISDGLVQDLGHICRASGVNAEIDANLLPFSGPVKHVVTGKPAMLNRALTGGDDYELLFTAMPAVQQKLHILARKLHVPLSPIGTITSMSVEDDGPQVRVTGPNGRPMHFVYTGYQHFKEENKPKKP